MQKGGLIFAVFSVALQIFLQIYCVQSCQSLLPSKCLEVLSKDGCCTINETMMCCNTTSFYAKEALGGVDFKGIKYLHFYNLNMSKLTLYSSNYLETLSITNGNVSHISIEGGLNNTKCLNLSGNSLLHLHILENGSVPKLEILDLSQNNLTTLPAALETKVQNLTLDISGNNQIQCQHIREFVDARKDTLTIDFRNKNETKCSMTSSFDWFNSTEYISLSHFEDVIESETQCQHLEGLQHCHCRSDRLWFIGQQLVITLDVDCSNSQLKSLPPRLPVNTVALNVSNNNITNLDQMKESSYSRIRRLSADNNHISSITVLEGTSFINNFSMLSIRGNNLTSIPTYFLSNSFDRNYALAVHLGGNKLICDCNTAQVLKGWLLSNKKFIRDYDEVGCRNYPKKVMELEQQDVCVTQRSWTDYIYYIIAGEVALFIFLVSKVSYDYWVFKTAGYLPWPASKMPKLPCDMFFES